jgi:hypothetical protein
LKHKLIRWIVKSRRKSELFASNDVTGLAQGPIRVTLDGQPSLNGTLNLVNDQREHIVEVLFGPSAAESDRMLSEACISKERGSG